jgi:hypothetical protein
MLLALLAASRTEAAGGSQADVDFFEKKIRPVLAEHCYKCHSQAAAKLKAGLLLDGRDGLRKGGESGPAIIPGDVKNSLLLRALRYEEPRMPPTGKLPAAVLTDFEAWVRKGAPDPRTGAVVKGGSRGSDWWAFRPVRKPPVPAVADAAWPATGVDRFILARLEGHGLRPARDADRQALLRRVTYALTGLPPTPAQVEAFLHDSSPRAYENVVDRLLASPHFGERWARHWMDLVCYSETHGIEHDALLPHAWRYRDYLIRAFNDDVPYDRFVREHLAGDLLPPRWNRRLGINESPLGTTFFRFVELYPTPVDVKNEEMSVLELQIDTFGKTFQGLTVACARCHDHKFDPISARDYHALYGIFASARVTMQHLDDPARLHVHDAELGRLKHEVRRELAGLWRAQLASWPGLIAEALRQGIPARSPPGKAKQPEPKSERDRWTRALQAAAGQPARPLYPLAQLARARPGDGPAFAARWGKLAAQRPGSPSGRYTVLADFSGGDLQGWYVQGRALGQANPSGDFAVAPAGPALLTGIYPRGRFSHLLSDRHGGALRSPNFTVRHRYISALVCGTNDARLRLVIENFPGDELLFATVMPRLTGGALQLVTLPIRDRWDGRRAYLEVIPRDEMTYPGRIPDASKMNTDGRSGVGIRKVVLHDDPQPPEPESSLPDAFWQPVTGPAMLAQRFTSLTAAALDAWAEERCTDAQASLLDTVVRAGVLANQAPKDHPATAAVARYRAVEAHVPVPQRVPGLIEEEGFDVPLFPRGKYQLAKRPVPRRYLEVLHSTPYRPGAHDSGRRQLAEEIASPSNPLTARVLVNRLWHHLFGAGLVRSADNFGKLGELPSHPELLDWLAADFVENGWSIKHTLRQLAISLTFRLASDVSPRARELDPDNRLCSHASVRRLDAESLRDALLSVSGRLDHRLFDLSVPLPAAPYRDFYMPVAGPLDGHGRRSLYLEQRRNFPCAFLQTFDQPRPLATTGQRPVTNVPAQALALQNDPFVMQQAEAFAQRVLADAKQPPAARVGEMYLLALSRPPEAGETERALAFLEEQAATYGQGVSWQADPRVWRDLAHALFNLKEFLYLR